MFFFGHIINKKNYYQRSTGLCLHNIKLIIQHTVKNMSGNPFFCHNITEIQKKMKWKSYKIAQGQYLKSGDNFSIQLSRKQKTKCIQRNGFLRKYLQDLHPISAEDLRQPQSILTRWRNQMTGLKQMPRNQG